MARRDVRQIVSLSLGHWLQALAGWIAKWASLVAAQGEHKDQAAGQTAAGTENKWRRDANGETGISRTEETIREPGQPPAHWVERLGDSGPPAHWLQWIRERTPGYPDVESTEFVHVSVPRQSPSVQGFPDRGARPASPEPRATSPSGLAGTSAAVGDDLQTADEDTTQGPDALYPQEAPVRRMHSTHTPTVQAQERTDALRLKSVSTHRPEEISAAEGSPTSSLPRAPLESGDTPASGHGPGAGLASGARTETDPSAYKSQPEPPVREQAGPDFLTTDAKSLGQGNLTRALRSLPPKEHPTYSAERAAPSSLPERAAPSSLPERAAPSSLPEHAGAQPGHQSFSETGSPPSRARSSNPATTETSPRWPDNGVGSQRWANQGRVGWPSEVSGPAFEAPDRPSQTGAGDEQWIQSIRRMQSIRSERVVDRWPSLPDEGRSVDEAASAADWESTVRAWQRLQRLDWEQRGILWNESPF